MNLNNCICNKKPRYIANKTKTVQGCRCYTHLDSRDDKPIKIIVNSNSKLAYCGHCGNIIDSFIALQLLCKNC